MILVSPLKFGCAPCVADVQTHLDTRRTKSSRSTSDNKQPESWKRDCAGVKTRICDMWHCGSLLHSGSTMSLGAAADVSFSSLGLGVVSIAEAVLLEVVRSYPTRRPLGTRSSGGMR